MASKLKTESKPKHNWECDAITEGLRTVMGFPGKGHQCGTGWTLPRRGSELSHKLSDAQDAVWIILGNKRRHQKYFISKKSTEKYISSNSRLGANHG